MKNLVILWLIFNITGHSLAQDSRLVSTHTLPSGPLLNPIPDHTKWTIVGPGNPGKASKRGKHIQTTISGSRDGEVLHLITVSGNGEHSVTWTNGHVQVTMNAGWKKPAITTSAGEANFRELSWISAKNFTEIKKRAGHGECMYFKDSILPSGYENLSPSDKAAIIREGTNIEAMRIPVAACVEVQSKLPVEVQIGEEKTFYKFEPLPPGFKLTFPPEIQAAITDQEQKTEAEPQVPVRP